MSGLAEIVCDIAFPRPERVYPHALLVELKVRGVHVHFIFILFFRTGIVRFYHFILDFVSMAK